jgi:predicted RNA-binding protein with PIN domain
MALHLIVDGYNVTETHKELFPGSARSAREILIESVRAVRPQGSARNRITIVFDGKPGVTSPAEKSIDVRFTRGKEADWMIYEMVRKSKNPKQVRVITDDKDLGRKVSVEGAGVMTTVQFIKKLFPRTRARGPAKRADTEKLTQELEKIWLKQSR